MSLNSDPDSVTVPDQSLPSFPDFTQFKAVPPEPVTDQHLEVLYDSPSDILCITIPDRVTYKDADGQSVENGMEFCLPDPIYNNLVADILTSLGALKSEIWDVETDSSSDYKYAHLQGPLSDRYVSFIEETTVDKDGFLRVGAEGPNDLSGRFSQAIRSGEVVSDAEIFDLKEKFSQIDIRSGNSEKPYLSFKYSNSKADDLHSYKLQELNSRHEKNYVFACIRSFTGPLGVQSYKFQHHSVGSRDPHYRVLARSQNDQLTVLISDRLDSLPREELLSSKCDTYFDDPVKEAIGKAIVEIRKKDTEWCTQLPAAYDPESRDWIRIPNQVLDSPLTVEEYIDSAYKFQMTYHASGASAQTQLDLDRQLVLDTLESINLPVETNRAKFAKTLFEKVRDASDTLQYDGFGHPMDFNPVTHLIREYTRPNVVESSRMTNLNHDSGTGDDTPGEESTLQIGATGLEIIPGDPEGDEIVRRTFRVPFR